LSETTRCDIIFPADARFEGGRPQQAMFPLICCAFQKHISEVFDFFDSDDLCPILATVPLEFAALTAIFLLNKVKIKIK